MPTAWPRAVSLSPSLCVSLSARLQLISTLSNLSLSTVSCLGIHLIFMSSKMLRPLAPSWCIYIYILQSLSVPRHFSQTACARARRLFIIFLFIVRRARCTFLRPSLASSLSLSFTPSASLSHSSHACQFYVFYEIFRIAYFRVYCITLLLNFLRRLL